MAYNIIDQDLYDGDLINGTGLHAAVTTKQSENARHLLRNRLKRHVINYNILGKLKAELIPNSDALRGLDGINKNAGVSEDKNNIGLQFSTPPSEVLCLPPIPWPTSSTANKIRVTLLMRADSAPVEVYLFAKNSFGSWGLDVGSAGFLDTDNVWQFDETTKTGDNYVEVGTSTPTDLYFCPVVLELDIAPQGKDGAVHRPYDYTSPTDLYICFHSTQGELDVTAKSASGAVPSGFGTTLQLDSAATWNNLVGTIESIGTYHRWLQIEQLDTFASALPVPANQAWRHIVQIRPDDPDDPSTGGAHLVFWPPIRPDSLWDLDNTNMNIYRCGVATIASICIEELYT